MRIHALKHERQAMSTEVNHKGIRVLIREKTTTVNGKQYTNYVIEERLTGKRKRHKRASLDEAKALARGLAETKEVIPAAVLKREMLNAIDYLGPTGKSMDEAASIFAEAYALVGEDIAEACRFWKANKPASNFKPVKLTVSGQEFLDEKRGRVCERRQKTNCAYLNALHKTLPGVFVHDIKSGHIEKAVNAKEWAAKTRNDALGLYSLFFRWCIKRGYCSINPASPEAIAREKRAEGDIGIFTPAELRKIFASIHDDLIPLMALWSFSGLRQAEIARLTWQEIGAALESGKLYLPKSKSKTCARSIPLRDNLKTWLIAYRQPAGMVLPENWQGLEAMSELARTIARHSKVEWKTNGPRHSFASYSLAEGVNPSELVRQMGNSLRQLESHYWARSQCLTKEQAQEWFDISPEPAVVAQMPMGVGHKDKTFKMAR
jgi:integrase